MFLFGFNIYVLKIEYALHLVLACMGMYKLIKTTTKSKSTALTIALLFPFTGLFISNASHYSFIYSMAWLPFVFHYFIQGYDRKKYYYFILCGAALALCTLGGYVVFPILSCYVLALLFLYQLTKQRSLYHYIQTTAFATVAALVFFVLCSGFIFSVATSLPYQVRADALSLQAIQTNPFTPRSLLSFLLPFSTTAQTGFFDTDVTMGNAYVGLCTFPLIAIGIVYGKRKQNIILLFFAFFCLLAAFGAHAPVREWLYHTLPFMKMFRHPAIFRAGTIISLLIIAADGLRITYNSESPLVKRTLLISITSLLISIGAVFIIALYQGTAKIGIPNILLPEAVNKYNNIGNLWANILSQCMVQAVLLGILLIGLTICRSIKAGRVISLILILDVVIAAQMNIAGTIVSDTRTKDFALAVNKMPEGFPLDITSAVNKYNVYAGPELAPMVYNANLLRREVCTETFNPFALKSFAQFNQSGVYYSTINQPLVYISNTIKPYTDLERDSLAGNIGLLYADVPHAIVYDSTSTHQVSLLSSSVNSVALKTVTDKPSIITLLQCKYPGWKAYIDEKDVSIVQSNYAFMSVLLPAGVHTVKFNFQPAGIVGLIACQCIVWMVLLLIVIRHRFSS